MIKQRVKFEKGQQQLFVGYVTDKLKCLYVKELLKYKLGVSYSSLKQYYREECLLPFFLFKKLCSLAKINSNSLDVKFLDENWGAVEGGKKGIVSMREKYSNKLHEWRIKGGKTSSLLNTKVIKHPALDKNLSEFIGAHLGDGTMTKYFIKISGDYRYDLHYFNYLSKLVFNLFRITPSIVKEKNRNTVYLIISSKEVCSFLNKNYGIPFGNKIKNKAKIPEKIMKNKRLAVSCLRGLVDTDGSVSRRGRNGNQFCVNFTSHNPILLHQVKRIGKDLSIFTYASWKDVGTNKWVNIEKYFSIIGSSNQKHIIRFLLRKYENKAIYLKDIPLYAKKDLYRNMNLPFKMGSWSSG